MSSTQSMTTSAISAKPATSSSSKSRIWTQQPSAKRKGNCVHTSSRASLMYPTLSATTVVKRVLTCVFSSMGVGCCDGKGMQFSLIRKHRCKQCRYKFMICCDDKTSRCMHKTSTHTHTYTNIRCGSKHSACKLGMCDFVHMGAPCTLQA